MNEDEDKTKGLSSIQDNSKTGKLPTGPKLQKEDSSVPAKFVLRPSGFNPFNIATNGNSKSESATCEKKPKNSLNHVNFVSEKKVIATKTFCTTKTPDSKFLFGQYSQNDIKFLPFPSTIASKESTPQKINEDEDKTKGLSFMQDNVKTKNLLTGPKIQKEDPFVRAKFVLRPSGFNPFDITTNDNSKSKSAICAKKPNNVLNHVNFVSEKKVADTETFCTTNTANSKFLFGQYSQSDVKFLPLASTSDVGVNLHQDKEVPDRSETPTPTSSTSSRYLFGQNLIDKVVLNDTSPYKIQVIGSTDSSKVVFGERVIEKVIIDGKTFETLPSTSQDTSNKLILLESDASKEKQTKSLAESSKEYEAARENATNKRKYAKVEGKTDQEEETNIFSMACKLFEFENRNWQERGWGTLRLNKYLSDDCLHYESRIVVRASGTLRVILNAKVFADMFLQKANEKSIQLTANDSNGEIKIFLIASSPANTTKLFMHLQDRLNKEVARRKLKQPVTESE